MRSRITWAPVDDDLEVFYAPGWIEDSEMLRATLGRALAVEGVCENRGDAYAVADRAEIWQGKLYLADGEKLTAEALEEYGDEPPPDIVVATVTFARVMGVGE